MSLRGDIGGSDSGNNSDETTSRTDGRFLQTAAPGARQGTMADSFETNLLRLLQATREQKAAFAADAKRIAERCRTEHADAHKKATEVDGGEDVDMTDAGGAKTGALCRTCFNGLLAAVYAAYTTPAQPQWYASRQAAFLGELDRLLDDVRVLRAPLALVDEWVAAQKRAWLQGQLVEAAALQRLVGSAATATTGRTGLATKLVDPDTDVAEVLRAVVAAEAVARTPNGTDDRDTGRLIEDAQTAARALQQTTSRSEQGTIFRDSLFPGGVPELAATRTVAQRLLDGTVGLDEGLRAVEQALGGGENAAGRAGKMEKHRKRLAELRRAKAAHEAQKLKRMKPVDVPYFLQDEAPCATCGRSADPQRSPFCLVCFLEVDYCLRENQTVWCTVACMKESYVCAPSLLKLYEKDSFKSILIDTDPQGQPLCCHAPLCGGRPLRTLKARTRDRASRAAVLFLPRVCAVVRDPHVLLQRPVRGPRLPAAPRDGAPAKPCDARRHPRRRR